MASRSIIPDFFGYAGSTVVPQSIYLFCSFILGELSRGSDGLYGTWLYNLEQHTHSNDVDFSIPCVPFNFFC